MLVGWQWWIIKADSDRKPTDTEMLNWLDKNTRGYGAGWICRDSASGRGLRVHETSRQDANRTVRGAIAKAMEAGI